MANKKQRKEIVRHLSQDGKQMMNTENRLDLPVSERMKLCFTTELLWRNTTVQLRKLNEYEIQSIGFSR